MTTLAGRLAGIQPVLDALARQHDVPGATLAIRMGPATIEMATGVVNRNTGVETTPDSLFQIGSNTKLYTTTLVMQLVDEGAVDLDQPVRTYVPDFALAEEDHIDEITVRRLLSHTSGIQGDYFEDFGWGDDTIERYVASLAKLDLVHPPGAMFSYCNSGFVLAGHLVEKVTGQPYAQVLHDKLLKPAGLSATTVLPEQMLRYRYAVGHVPPAPGSRVAVAGRVLMGRSTMPAGSITSATARDVLGFVALHLAHGAAPDGGRILERESVALMQTPQADRPGMPGGQIGLGWVLGTWDGHRVIGHTGGTIGQLSFLQVMPDDDLAVCLLTNSATGGALWTALAPYLFDELAGVAVPLAAAPDEPPRFDLTPYTGRYSRLGLDYDVTVEDGTLIAIGTMSGAMAALEQRPSPPIRLTPIDPSTFFATTPAGDLLISFLEFDDDGRPQYFHAGSRASRRAPNHEEPDH